MFEESLLQQRIAGRAHTDAAIGVLSLLGEDERQALADVTSSVQHVRAGADLLRESATSQHLYLIVEGWACRYAITRDGLRQLSALIFPGDVANVDALAAHRAGHGIRALSALKVLAIGRQHAAALADDYPAIARLFLDIALKDHAILGRWMVCNGRLSARRRLAHLLCELSARCGRQGINDGSFDMALTQEQLGDVLGLTSVHVNRMMQELRGDGFVVTDGRTVSIPDLRRLQHEGEFDPAYLRLRMAA
ncbi:MULTISPECIES: Crp/Fnr family transcriptional regulator [Sphingomonas]|uniref:Crp/Fnr family transcriptional regulator n=1 Tax=Sphingomonas kyungheensis TaxID=1069987 RepID=A0ABU8H5V4_9SPHN|nr:MULTISPECIES: Crp/Fnr family transcriptional regulator [unclassified Sphingomonas]EZP48744.1 putative transcriptional regulator, Crp/Fnr family [Sphingomonas sp. RIT328]